MKINAGMSIQQFARQWDQQMPRLERAMQELDSQGEIFDRWERIVRDGADIPPTGDIIRDKRAVSPGMLELRAILPVAERTFNTLVGLKIFSDVGLLLAGITQKVLFVDLRESVMPHRPSG